MKILDPGHMYNLNVLDWPENAPGEPAQTLVFVKREGLGYPGNVGHHPGTNIQEVLRALIDRVKYLNKQIPDSRNYTVIDALRESMWALECRAAERHDRFDKFIRNFDLSIIETYSFCHKCGHIGCNGECH